MEKNLNEEREMHQIRSRRATKGNEMQAEREGGRERGREGGVAAGQASCHGAPLTPCTERHEEERSVQREGSEESERKRAGSKGSETTRQKRK